jgi:predicted transcriptional regulator
MTANTTDNESRTLHLRVAAAERTRNELLGAIRAMERGEEVESRHVLDLPDEAALARVVSETNLALVRAIARNAPESTHATAALVDHDYKDVHRNFTELADLGVIELNEEGRSKRPVVRFNELVIEVPMTDDPDTDTTDALTV